VDCKSETQRLPLGYLNAHIAGHAQVLRSAAAVRDESLTRQPKQIDMFLPQLPDLPLVILLCERPETVLISLWIAHKQFAKLPSAVSIGLLDALAEHCIAFGIRGPVSEAINPWVERLAPQAVR
jgi:hypothetical protein